MDRTDPAILIAGGGAPALGERPAATEAQRNHRLRYQPS
jgi:hypothetical protein